MFDRWLLKQLKSWLLSQNEKATPPSFFGWILANQHTFSIINNQLILKFTKQLHKQLIFSANLKVNKNSQHFQLVKQANRQQQQPIAKPQNF